MESEEAKDFQVALQAFREDVERWVQHWIGPGGMQPGIRSEIGTHRNPNLNYVVNVHWWLSCPHPLYTRRWTIHVTGRITDLGIDDGDEAFYTEVGNLNTGWEAAKKHFYSNYQYMNAVKKYRNPIKHDQLQALP